MQLLCRRVKMTSSAKSRHHIKRVQNPVTGAQGRPEPQYTLHVLFNPRPDKGGGSMRPPEGFLRCAPNYWSDRIVLGADIFHSLWGVLCATFGEKLTGSC